MQRGNRTHRMASSCLSFQRLASLSKLCNQCKESRRSKEVATYHTHRHMHTKKTPGLHLLFTVHRVNTAPSEAASQQQDVVVRHVLAQKHPLPMSLINSPAVSLSSCPSNRGTHTHTHTSSTASPSANVTHSQSELLCIMLPMLSRDLL